MLDKPQLGQDLGGAEVAAEALMAGGAKAAAHRAARLRRHAQRGAIVLRDEHGFNRVAVSHIEKPLDGAVGRILTLHHRQCTYFSELMEFVAEFARQIRHLVEIADTAVMHPAKQLGGAELFFAQPLTPADQPGQIKVE